MTTHALPSDDRHIVCYVDSITYGAAATGASTPKWRHSWPGRLARLLHAPSETEPGTGIVVPWNTLWERPDDDPRLRFVGTVSQLVGAGTNEHPRLGPLGRGMMRIDGGSAAVSFEGPRCTTSFAVYTRDSGVAVTPRITVDGHDVAPDCDVLLAAEDGALRRWSVHRDPSWAPHLSVSAPDGHLDVWGLEACAPGPRVTTMARNGCGSIQLALDNGLAAGLAYHVDAVRPDLAILLLGANDRSTDQEVFLSRIRLTLARLQAVNADVLLVGPPDFDHTDPLIGPTTLADRRADLETLAAEFDVPLLRLDRSWPSFNEAQRQGLFADGIHPGDDGLERIAGEIHGVLRSLDADRAP